MKQRFNSDVNTLEEVLDYYTNRSIQMLPHGWSWDGEFKVVNGGVEITFEHRERGPFKSVIIFSGNVGKGYMKQYFKDNPGIRYVSGPMCKKMKSWLDYQEIVYTSFEPVLTPEYISVQRFYGDKRASRSTNFYMNHIDEGIYIIGQLKVDSEDVKKAFCLHPLVQDDEHFMSCKPLARWSSKALMLSVEYRNVANSFLPPMTGKGKPPTRIAHPDVAIMLQADKIQNAKDYELYVRPTAPPEKVAQLDEYFSLWFDTLGVEKELYDRLAIQIQNKTGRGKKTI